MKNKTEKQLRQLVRNQQRSVAQRVRRRRHAVKLTQEKLAQLAGVDRKTVNRIEQNHFSPSVETLTRLATVLRVKTVDLMK